MVIPIWWFDKKQSAYEWHIGTAGPVLLYWWFGCTTAWDYLEIIDSHA